LLSKISELFAKGEIDKIIAIMKNYLKNTVPFFILLVIVSYLLIPYVLDLISSGTLTLNNIDLIKWIFIGLAVWFLIILIESAFTSVGIAAKKSSIFIFTNSIFIIIFFTLSFLFKNQVGVLIIPLAAVIGQLINFMLYSNFVLKIFGSSLPVFIKQKSQEILHLKRD
jgi:hypothetical protein